MITLSLCMIIKNEEHTLPRILEQMKDIADEIIIVDTGSTDKSREIAARYTDLVFDYPWNQDFSAARNFACEKASMDYWMWLDADDVICPDQQKNLLRLKEELDPSTDMVMMKYITSFDENNLPAFSYYRERWMKTTADFRFLGKVHEAIVPSGHILYSPIEIEHRKEHISEPNRNLNIYETMLKNGEILEPRHQFYYGRELLEHGRFSEAARVLQDFLDDPRGWIENKLDACLQLSRCYSRMNYKKEQMSALFQSFSFDTPRAEICCEIGRLMVERQDWNIAVYWFLQALNADTSETSGAFFSKDAHGYLPFIWLCVCFDRLGNHSLAYEYHKKAQELHPGAEEVLQNQAYFERFFKDTKLVPFSYITSDG